MSEDHRPSRRESIKNFIFKIQIMWPVNEFPSSLNNFRVLSATPDIDVENKMENEKNSEQFNMAERVQNVKKV